MITKEKDIEQYLEIGFGQNSKLTEAEVSDLNCPASPGLVIFKVFRALNKRIEKLEQQLAARPAR